jgi:hypothetical protein
MRRPWRGRVRDRVWKSFIALGEIVSTGDLVRRCWPRKQRFEGARGSRPGEVQNARWCAHVLHNHRAVPVLAANSDVEAATAAMPARPATIAGAIVAI